MSEETVQFLVATFDDDDKADAAMDILKQAKKEQKAGIHQAAVVKRDEKNKLHIREYGDIGGGAGALSGGALGAAIGLLAGPAGVVVGAAAGALVGGISTRLVDSGIPDKRLKELGEAMKADTSAVVAIVDDDWLQRVSDMMSNAGATIMSQPVKAEALAKADEEAAEAAAPEEPAEETGETGETPAA